MWIDSHCHLDAPEWSEAQRLDVREQARAAGVSLCILPAVARSNWAAVRELAHAGGDAYALGIHPLYVPAAEEADLEALEAELRHHLGDPRLVALGEIGLDFFVPALAAPAMRAKQQHFYRAQLALAQRLGLPVLLHVRRSADALLHGLRALSSLAPMPRLAASPGGLVHAFSGSAQQAQAFIGLGFGLGFGGAATYERARRLRALWAELPPSALALETDAPDMPPQWRYVPAALRAVGQPQPPNRPAELARIGAELAAQRGLSAPELAALNRVNLCRLLPRLERLLQTPLAA